MHAHNASTLAEPHAPIAPQRLLRSYGRPPQSAGHRVRFNEFAQIPEREHARSGSVRRGSPAYASTGADRPCRPGGCSESNRTSSDAEARSVGTSRTKVCSTTTPRPRPARRCARARSRAASGRSACGPRPGEAPAPGCGAHRPCRPPRLSLPGSAATTSRPCEPMILAYGSPYGRRCRPSGWVRGTTLDEARGRVTNLRRYAGGGPPVHLCHGRDRQRPNCGISSFRDLRAVTQPTSCKMLR